MLLVMGLTHFLRGCVSGVALLLCMSPRILPFSCLALRAFCAEPAAAVEEPTETADARLGYDLPRGDAATTLSQFARISGRQIMFMMDKVRGQQTNAVKGEYSPREALDHMLAGTELSVWQDQVTGAFVIGRDAHPSQPPAVKPAAEPNPQRKEDLSESMKRKNIATAIIGWLALAISSPAGAQTDDGRAIESTGSIKGVVVDKTTGEALENARVAIQGSVRFALTERGGAYTIHHVPEGEYNLVVYYTGFNTATHPVKVSSGGEVTANIGLTSNLLEGEVVELGAYMVDIRRGQADEIMQRRQAVNVVDVVSSKTFGEMADGSLSISRLAGMTGGTGIRGIAGEYNLVRIDGAAMASPSDSTASGSNRSVDINQVPGDMIERIEVTKSPRPDMDADAVGGTINLVTRSSLDRGGRRTTYSVGGMFSPSYEITKMGYLASFEHSDILGSSRRLGYTVTLNHNRRYSNTEAVITDYFTDLVQGVPLGGPAPVSSFRAEQEIRYEDRTGVGLKFDYKPSDQLVMQFGLLYQNRFSRSDSADWRLTNRDNLLQWDEPGQFWYAPARVRDGRGNIDGAVPLMDANGNVIAHSSGRGQGGVLPTYDEYVTDFLTVRQLRYQNRIQDQHRDTYTFQSSGRYTGLKDTKIDYNLGYSWGKAKRRESPEGQGTFQYDLTGSVVRIDRTKNFYLPEVIFLGGTDPDAVDSVGRVNNLQLLDATQTEDQLGVSVDVERSLATRTPVYLKSGLRLRRATRDIERGEHQYSYNGSHTAFIGSTSINPFGRYPSSNIPDIGLVRASLKNNPNLWTENMDVYIQKQYEHNGYVSESVQGAYLMADVQFRKFAFLPGVRAEWTQFKGIGNVRDRTQTDPNLQWGNMRTDKGSYDNMFPHFHLRFEPFDRFVIRAAWSTGIGRPAWRDIIPEGTIEPNSQTITMNNSELRPQYTNNFDVNFEYYLEPAGLISVNFFRKEIDDLIYSMTDVIKPGMGWDSVYEGWTLRTSGNAAWAWVEGVEFDIRQQLSFLPGWLGRLSVYANLTLLDTEGNYSTPDGSVTSNIPGFVPKVANAGISYSGKRFSVRVQSQYRDHHLSNWDERSTEYWRYNESSTYVDTHLTYRLNKRFSLFCNVSNIFEESPVQYQARPNQPYRVRQDSRRFDFGIRGSL